MADAVSDWLKSLAPRERRIVQSLRRTLREIVPEAEETQVWNAISYHRPDVGGRVKGAVCQIVCKNGTIRLDFIHGIRLPDPASLLEGDGLSKRHVVIESEHDVERPEILALVRGAAEIKW